MEGLIHQKKITQEIKIIYPTTSKELKVLKN